MNRTLFDCGVRKKVELKNGCMLDITPTMEKTAEISKSAEVKCNVCGKSFRGQQYLDSHMKFKHPMTENSHEGSKQENMFANRKEADAHCSLPEASQSGSNDPIVLDSNEVESLGNKRRGSKKRKSYTVEFKKKTLDLFYSLKSSKHRYNIVSKEKGVHRSLIQKWNKNRNQILKELELNKKGKNSGNIRDARQRRKIVAGRSKQSERYPLAANLLIAEFKVRRAAGCKITKLWFRKKMKAKIEMTYGKK